MSEYLYVSLSAMNSCVCLFLIQHHFLVRPLKYNNQNIMKLFNTQRQGYYYVFLIYPMEKLLCKTYNMSVGFFQREFSIICVAIPLRESSGVYFRCPTADSRVPINLLACQFPTLSCLRRHFRKAVHTAYSFCRPPSSLTSITHRAVMHLHTVTTSGLALELRQHAKRDWPTQFTIPPKTYRYAHLCTD